MADLFDVDGAVEGNFLAGIAFSLEKLSQSAGAFPHRAERCVPGCRARRSRDSRLLLAGGGLSGAVSVRLRRSLILHELCGGHVTYLTCSLTNLVVPFTPLPPSKLARNSSPRKALRGFLTPSFSSRPAYCCCLRAARNHFNTDRARRWGSASDAGATKMAGCSAQ